MSIGVYSKLTCPQCEATYRALLGAGLDITVYAVENDAAAHQRVTELGYMQAPVVITDDGHWSGFRPDKIDELKVRFGELTPRDRDQVNDMIKAIKQEIANGVIEIPVGELTLSAA